MISQRASVEAFIARARGAGVALGLVQVFIASPAPVSRSVALAITLGLAAYNVPATLIGRLPARWLEPVILVALAGDFLVASVWLFMRANGQFDPTFSLFGLVAIEAALLYEWRGVLPFIGAFLVGYSTQVWVRTHFFHFAFQPDVYLLQAGLTVLVAICLGTLTRQSESRRRAAEEAAAEADRQVALAQALHLVSGRVARTLKREQVVDTVVNSLRELFPRRWHALLLTESPEREIAYLPDGEPPQEFLTPNGPSFAGIEGPITISDLQTDERFLNHLAGPADLLLVYRSAVLLPLRGHGALLGLLVSLDTEPAAFPEAETRFLESLAHQSALALENARLYADVERMSLTDSTTGLLNRRAFDMRLEEELVRARRYSLPLSLMMLDVDHFKDYNDTFGHLAGDEILKQLARILESDALRHVDLPFRFGGEEFAVILPHTSAGEALSLAQRLCQSVTAQTFPESQRQPGGRLTISAGVAAFPDHGATGRDLVDHADLALYAAKRSGRNQAVLYQAQLRQERDQAAFG